MTSSEALEIGLQHHQAGRLADAKAIYQQVLAMDPGNADALHLLGLAALQSAEPEQAERLIAQAIRCSPSNPQFLNSLGEAQRASGKWHEALASYDRALAIQPDHTGALYNRGLALQALERYDEALASYRGAAALKPDHADALNNSGSILLRLGRNAEALDSFDRTLATRPDHPEAWNNRGLALQRLRRLEEAVGSYDRALALKAALSGTWSNRGNALRDLGRLDEAAASYDQALALDASNSDVFFNRAILLRTRGHLAEALRDYDKGLAADPHNADAWVNRAALAMELGRHAEALANCDQAIAIDARHCGALFNRGVALQRLGRYEEAADSYKQALAVNPASAETLKNCALALQRSKRYQEALAMFDRALALDPGYAEAHWARSECRLLLGDFAGGWEEYEWRWSCEALSAQRPAFEQPLWRGEPLRGKTILLHGEQGFGDTLQFVRYASEVASRGARVLLGVPPQLKRLLSSVPGVAQVSSRWESFSGYDYHCPLLSLPLAFNTRLATIPAAVPYLRVPSDMVNAWQAKLGPKTRFRIGIAWSGRQPRGDYRNRSIALRELAAVAPAHVELVSLQKDMRPEDAASLRDDGRIAHFGDALADFADTAALMSLMDLIISVDTAVAHLAGALAKPVWIMLPYAADWRWLEGRSDSPWYPTARLFRQPDHGDWVSVLDAVRRELALRV